MRRCFNHAGREGNYQIEEEEVRVESPTSGNFGQKWGTRLTTEDGDTGAEAKKSPPCRKRRDKGGAPDAQSRPMDLTHRSARDPRPACEGAGLGDDAFE